ncbi:microtubule-associated protein 65-9 [Actinidia rufa]|uniref:Microtubule-associated protein 65-9 n=1 Tax=Actinidia rufa TaxID=165716 RepID=A0A7J0FXK9_9ERIC|nr:microtubule-associated protein 65-9 [Actinidia rufa]
MPVEGHRAKRKPFEVKSTLIGVESSLVRSVSKQISHNHSPRRRLTVGSAFPTRSGRVSDEIGASFPTSFRGRSADSRKVRFARLKLISRAKFFWQSTEAQRRQNPISDWNEMIEVLSGKYIPYSYYQQKRNLEAMQERRRNQFVEVLAQIEKISNELYNDFDDTPSSLVVDESDLSIRKLGQLHSELRDLQRDKDDRLNHVLDLLKTVHSLCEVLSLDFEKTVTKVHSSLGIDFEGTKSLTNKTVMGLTSTIQRLRDIKLKRVQRFKQKTKAAIIIQTHWRRHKAYSSYRRFQKAAIICQYSWRRRVAWKELGKFKMAARVPKVERIDLIGVDKFLCVLPPYFRASRQQFEDGHYLDFVHGTIEI